MLIVRNEKPEDIAAAKTLIFNGDAALSSALNSSQVLQGQSQFGSQGNMMVWAAGSALQD